MNLILIESNTLEFIVNSENSNESPEDLFLRIEDALLSGEISEDEACEIIGININ